eukprot:770160-Karenia_brevis.AAC.1
MAVHGEPKHAKEGMQKSEQSLMQDLKPTEDCNAQRDKKEKTRSHKWWPLRSTISDRNSNRHFA